MKNRKIQYIPYIFLIYNFLCIINALIPNLRVKFKLIKDKRKKWKKIKMKKLKQYFLLIDFLFCINLKMMRSI